MSSGTGIWPVGSMESGEGSLCRRCLWRGRGGESGSGSPGTSLLEHGICESDELLLGSFVVEPCRCCCCWLRCGCCGCCCCCCVALRVCRVVGAGRHVLRPGGRPGGGGEGGVTSSDSSSSRSSSLATMAGFSLDMATMSLPLPGKRSLKLVGVLAITSYGPSYGQGHGSPLRVRREC